jgi:small subunit ribosomal protein S21
LKLRKRGWLSGPFSFLKEKSMQILVRDNNVEQALRALKRKLQREGVLRELKQRRAYEKPSEKRAREKADAIRRTRKMARKLAQREGLIPGPKAKPRPGAAGAGAKPAARA